MWWVLASIGILKCGTCLSTVLRERLVKVFGWTCEKFSLFFFE